MARRKDPPGEYVRTSVPGIYRRNGNYVVRIYDPLTKKRAPAITADTFEEAKRIKREEEAKKAARGKAGKATVASWAPRFNEGAGERRRRSESTRKHNAERIQAFVKDFADRELRSISKQEAHLWIKGGMVPPELEAVAREWDGAEERGGILYVPAHRSNLASVRAMFGDARHVDLIESNPFAGMGLEQGRGRSDIDIIDSKGSEGELDDLVRLAAQMHSIYGRHLFGPMIRVAAWTGLRPGELFALRPCDVELDCDAPRIHVRRAFNAKTREFGDTKNHERRVVALLPAAESVLAELLRQLREEGASEQEPVFRTQHGKAFTQRHLHYYWDPVRAAFASSRPPGHWLPERMARYEAEHGKAGGDLDFYELRHHFGTRLADAGVSPYDIAKMMGHRDGGKLAMERYIHTDRDMAIERTLQAFRRRDAA